MDTEEDEDESGVERIAGIKVEYGDENDKYILKSSMIQDDINAYIYNGKLDNDFSTDYNNEF